MKNDMKKWHVVLRTSKDVTVPGRTLDIVKEHNRVIKKKGAVAIAKFGARPSASRITSLQKRITRGLRAHLYLVFKQHGNFFGYFAPIQRVFISDSASDPPAVYPTYYDELGLIPAVWFVLSKPFKQSPLDGLKLVSNGRPLLDVLAESRTTMMLVTKGADQNLK